MRKFTATVGDFDEAKFKARYGIADEDIQAHVVNGLVYVRVGDKVVLPNVPILDKPDPPHPLKTAEDYAGELADVLGALGQRRDELVDKLLRLTGKRSPEVKL